MMPRPCLRRLFALEIRRSWNHWMRCWTWAVYMILKLIVMITISEGSTKVLAMVMFSKLSSAGLVYKHHGQEIVAKELGLSKDHPDVQHVFLAVYKSFMEVFFSENIVGLQGESLGG